MSSTPESSGTPPPSLPSAAPAIVRVAIDLPPLAHAAGIDGDDLYDYRWPGGPVGPGALVLVPFGPRSVVGVVVALAAGSRVDPARLRDVVALVADVPPLDSDWMALCAFAARYYHRPIGEVMLPSLPPALRRADHYEVSAAEASTGTVARATLPAIERAVRRADREARKSTVRPTGPDGASTRVLGAQQASALDAIRAALADPDPAPLLLHGITGSGKTEVYLRAIAEVVAAGRQALVLVPEINLTPQLAETFALHLPDARVASLHSGRAAGQRLEQWMLAHEGRADVLLGTRLAVLAPLPRLGLVVVDEEHDASYKQHEGLRYSARDLAVARARIGRGGVPCPVVLASATPSLESWAHARSGRYRKLVLDERAVPDARLPDIRLVPTLRAPLVHGLTATVRDAIADRVARREPVLIFHNRRGYAPVLACNACGWQSACPRCSVNAVFHKADRRLHCHHCGWQARVQRACPNCGNADLTAIGHGTQRVEENLQALFPDARIARIDRDSTRRKGAAATLLDGVHEGTLDILVGTQMLAKGHDFRNVTLVCVLDADNALYSHDFRAAERLFANLVQVAGRAGRGGARSSGAEVLIQTRAPDHPLFAALLAHDFDRFAADQLAERRAAGLPPYSYQAVLRADAATAVDALAFLREARATGIAERTQLHIEAEVELYDPVPLTIARVAHVERAQLLCESTSRRALHMLLAGWMARLREERTRVRWYVEVDPQDI